MPFDDEGTAAGEKYLINKGVFVAAVADIRTAFVKRENDRPATASATSAGFFRRSSSPTSISSPRSSPWPSCCTQAGKGVLVYLVKRKGFGDASPASSFFRPTAICFADDEIARPVHFLFRTTMRSYFLHILEVSRELRFFHNRVNIGSPYLLLQGRCDPEKRSRSETLPGAAAAI